MSGRITRREFSAGLVAAGAAMAARPSTLRAFPANERVRLGFIGVGNRGDQLVDAFRVHADAEITAICDVYDPYVEFARQKVGGKAFTTKNYRELLDREDIDAVVIATPDHWHALQFIDACAAGKDVYVEKPLSLTIGEGGKMVEAAGRHNRITQVGVQRRSSPIYQKVVKLIQDGAIGKVTACRCSLIRNECPMGMGKVPNEPPPSNLDWNMWLGPAPEVPYNPTRCFYKFRWFRDYSGGQVTNFGTHFLDVIQWAIGHRAPTGVFATGGRFAVDDERDLPDTMEVVWEYPGGTIVTFSQFNANGAQDYAKPAHIEFRGTTGTMYVHYRSFEIVPERIRTRPLAARGPLNRKEAGEQDRATEPVGEPLKETGRCEGADHARSFLDGVKSRKPCTCPIEVGHRSTSTTLLANVSLDRKRYITWDADAERVTNDPDANKLLSYQYREPWKLP